jgi:hypothetical protein
VQGFRILSLKISYDNITYFVMFFFFYLFNIFFCKNHFKKNHKISVAGEEIRSRRSTGLASPGSSATTPSSGTKVSRRSRSKSPFRSFRWRRGKSGTRENDVSDEEEGI